MLGIQIERCGGSVGVGFGNEKLAVAIVVQCWTTIPFVNPPGSPRFSGGWVDK